MLDRLACPECKNFSVEVKPFLTKQNEIIEGEISCSSCRRQYPINESIPNMLPDDLRLQKITKERSWQEWRKRLSLFKQRIKGWTEEDSRLNTDKIWKRLLQAKNVNPYRRN